MKYRFCKRMLRLGVLIAVCLTLLLRASGQSDLPDNIEVADCVTDVTEQPWTAQVLHFVNDIHCYYVPLVGDIDGDGFVEIVAGKAVTNVITPNGDGFNDVFKPQLEGDFLSLEMEIFDRWGKRVYRQESKESLSWDATNVSDGVYFCAIEYRCATSSQKRQLLNTSVTVVR